MKYAIIADIHANLEALTAVLADAQEQGCTHHAFLGDYVGYNADPKACLDIVRAMNAPCVKGNYDEYAAVEVPLTDFNPSTAKTIQWTRKQLTERDRRWLRDLPYVLELEHFTIVHSNLGYPPAWGYVFDKPPPLPASKISARNSVSSDTLTSPSRSFATARSAAEPFPNSRSIAVRNTSSTPAQSANPATASLKLRTSPTTSTRAQLNSAAFPSTSPKLKEKSAKPAFVDVLLVIYAVLSRI